MSKPVEPPLPTATDSHPADPTATSADIAPQFSRHHASAAPPTQLSQRQLRRAGLVPRKPPRGTPARDLLDELGWARRNS